MRSHDVQINRIFKDFWEFETENSQATAEQYLQIKTWDEAEWRKKIKPETFSKQTKGNKNNCHPNKSQLT
jgi:hypothetical protein